MVIIDAGYAVLLFQNKTVVKNVREVKKHVILDSNRGMVKLGEVGDEEFDELWFSCDDIANTFSHSLLVKHGCRIVSDTKQDLAFHVQKKIK